MQSKSNTTLTRNIGRWKGVKISPAEKRFLADGVHQDFRLDGRSCLGFRPVSIATQVIASAAGSCRLCAMETDIIAAVKFGVSTPSESNPDEGDVVMHIDCASQNASQVGDLSEHQLSRVIESLCLNREVLPRKQLCIAPALYCWRLFVDVMVLNSAGNLVDAIALAIRVAMAEAMVPKTTVFEDEVSGIDSSQRLTFEVDSIPESGSPLNIDKVPLCITVGQLAGRLVWDMTMEEEAAASTVVTVAVDNTGRCRGMHKTGTETLPLVSLSTIVQSSRVAGAKLHDHAAAALRMINESADEQSCVE